MMAAQGLLMPLNLFSSYLTALISFKLMFCYYKRHLNTLERFNIGISIHFCQLRKALASKMHSARYSFVSASVNHTREEDRKAVFVTFLSTWEVFLEEINFGLTFTEILKEDGLYRYLMSTFYASFLERNKVLTLSSLTI